MSYSTTFGLSWFRAWLSRRVVLRPDGRRCRFLFRGSLFLCPSVAMSVSSVLSLPLLFCVCILQIIATTAETEVPSDPPELTKRMFSYADLMNNFGGPSPLDFVSGNSFFILDEERPKREDEAVELLSAWKRSSPFQRGFLNGVQRNYLTKKDQFVAPGVLRFGKRMPGVLRFGKRGPQHEKKAVPGVLRFGKRADVPGVLRFGKRMPQVLRFG
ncbi:hypothetical protein niasHT_014265 [Heterodera trifolii]|uniref:Uncharacterized protein n=1 Tax=Heterodera trifolii TaxID=157864 RepID=A0ABD2LKD2_9BILA